MKQTLTQWLKAEWFALAVSLVVVLPNAIWYLDWNSPTEIVSIATSTPIVQPGGTLIIDYKVNRMRACSGTIQRVITDSQGVTHLIAPYDFIRDDNKKLGNDIVNRVSAPVPVGAAAGTATYHAEIDYYCNPQQRLLGRPIKVSTPPVEFRISGEDGSSLQTPSRVTPQSFGSFQEPSKATELGPEYDPTPKTGSGNLVATADRA